jgi:hypothetical protein
MDMIRFAKRQPSAPGCVRCGQRFHFLFGGERLAEQSCACGLVYRVETMPIDQFLDGRDTKNSAESDIAA